MNKQTLNALQSSIRKWERIVYAGGMDHGTRDCALCQIFFERGCYGCPVNEATGFDMCIGSPYHHFVEAFESETNVAGTAFVLNDETHEAAMNELAFLRGLLP